MARLFIFGLGYTARRIAAGVRLRGWTVEATGRNGTVAFEDQQRVKECLGRATHVLSSVPPSGPDGADPVLIDFEADMTSATVWLGYLSSTGVYGDTLGAWVDESAPTGTGRRAARTVSDALWLERGARVFRLPGIYGPGRSALERVRGGTAHRVDLPGQVFSRVHVDDIVRGVLAGLDAPPGAYNLADDCPASQNAVIEEACRLLGHEPPPLEPIERASLSPMAREFYKENRKVANGKAKRVLGWRPRYADYRSGLAAIASLGDDGRER